MKKVLIICYHFPPDAAIGAVRPAKFAKYLPEFGWEPMVYTLKEQYYETCDYDKLEAGLEGVRIYRGTLFPSPLQLYSHLKGLLVRKTHGNTSPTAEAYNGVVKEPDGNARHLLGSLLRLPDDKQGWIFNIATKGSLIARRHRVEAFVTSGPPMSTHLGGALVQKATGIRWIADFRDPWVAAPWGTIGPHVPLTSNLNKLLEAWVVKNADIVVSTTDSATAYFKSILDTRSKGKCLTISNGFDDDDFKSLKYTLPHESSKIKVVYAGSLYANRNPEPFLAALRKLISERLIPEEQLEIELIGDCLSFRGISVPRLVEQYGLQNIIRILDAMPYQVCLDRMANSSALLLFAQGQPAQIPGKVFDYIRINRPIFAIAEDGETKKILEPFTNAFVANPENIEDIAANFMKLLNMVKNGGHSLGIDEKIMRYSRRELTREFAECLG